MKLALSILCEHPKRLTGLTTMFHEFVSRSLTLFPEVRWLVFAGRDQPWPMEDRRIEMIRTFPANDRVARRLVADHFEVPRVAVQRGADALLTVGFVPLRKLLPTIMHVFSLQHLDPANKVGFARALYRRWVTDKTWCKADLIITNSKFAARQILSVHPECEGRLVQSYEGLQHEQFNPTAKHDEIARLKAHFNLQPGYFLWASNFYPYKQAELLIAGYARLDPALRTKHPLVMIGGSWEGGAASAQDQVRKLGISEDVHFLNWIDDEWLAPLYRHAIAFCLASREETFGRCVIESMACGTPCIVNDIPIMREVTDGEALLIDYRNPAAVQDGLRRLATDPALRADLSQRGLARARQFTFEKLTAERITAIQRLVSGRPSVTSPAAH